MDVFTYRYAVKNPKNIVTEKEGKKLPLFLSLTFYLVFSGRRLSHDRLK